MKNRSLRLKLLVGVATMSVFLLIVGLIGLFSVQHVAGDASQIAEMNLPKISHLAEMREAATSVRAILSRLIIPGFPEDMVRDTYAGFEKSVNQYKEFEANYRSLEMQTEEQKLYTEMTDSWGKTLDVAQKLVDLSRQKDEASRARYIQILLYEYRPIGAQHLKQLAELGAMQRKDGEYWTSQVREAMEFGSALAIITVIIGFTVSIITGWKFATGLSSRLTNVAHELSSGATDVASAASQVSATSTELSSSATEQAAALQETVASVDEVNAMVGKNAENAKKSQTVSSESQHSAEEGQGVVREMLQSMQEIQNSNGAILQQIEASNAEMANVVKVIREIGAKTQVINDIVFQTKLLSFNASVEAARAGDAGKGFAIVAEEVGNLARMSGNAATEISGMLEASIQKVDGMSKSMKSRIEQLVSVAKQKVQHGSETADRCAAVLGTILENVGSVNHMVGEIAEASQEQSLGVAEITKAMAQLDQVTQQNSKASQESSAAAAQLQKQAELLRAAVKVLESIVDGGVIEVAQASAPKTSAKVVPLRKPALQPTAQPAARSVQAKTFKKVVGDEFQGLPLENDSRFKEV